MLVASILMILAVLGAGSWLDYVQIRQSALDRIQSSSFLMEEHAVGTLNAADQVIQRARDIIGNANLKGLRRDRDVWSRLRDVADSQPSVVMLRVLDTDGATVFETTNFPSQPVHLADWAYFQEPKSGASVYVGAAVLDPTVGKPVFTLSRRLEGQGGQFIGVVLAAIDTTYFNQVYQRLRPAPRSSAGLIRAADGTYLARDPVWEQFVGRSVGPWYEFVAQQEILGPNTFKAPSPIDHIWRYYAYRPVAGYPLVVFAGESVDDVMAQWRRRFLWIVAASVLGIVGMLYFGWSARRGWWREQQGAQALEDTNARLQQALSDKDVLFREVHHRVKNNLQVVSNLLLLQGQRVGDRAAKAAFQETIDRVQSVAAVHQILYRTNQAVEIELDRYLTDLCATLADTYGAKDRGISVRVDAEACRVHIDQTIPLALIVNEALTNAFKYAFPTGSGGTLTVAFSCSNQDLHLSVADDGIGLPETATTGDSLGMTLIGSLTEQLDGHHMWQSESGGGTRLEITVPRRHSHQPT